MAGEQNFVSVLHTEFGEVRCNRERGDCKISLFNPRATEKAETVFFLNLFKALDVHLPEAQEAVRRYLREREKTAAGEERIDGKDEGSDVCQRWATAEELATTKTGDNAAAAAAATATLLDKIAGGSPDGASKGEKDVVLYSKILLIFGKSPAVRVFLEARVRDDRPYIILQRFWYCTKEESKTEQFGWLPCFGSFLFSLEDNASEILEFVEKNLALAKLSKVAKNVSANAKLIAEYDAAIKLTMGNSDKGN